MQRQIKRKEDEFIYEIRNNIRYVKPYFHEYVTYAKGRWIHRNIIDVLSEEFGAYPRSYWLNAVSDGNILVNGNIVNEHYQFENSDKLLHRTHRHEPPVTGDVEFLGENDKVLAINKPASLPMHTCGSYRYNTLKAIVSKEHLVPNQPELFLVHRLDRVTSGVVVMAKSSKYAKELCEDIKTGKMRKKYLARVKGIFPSMELSRLRQQSLETLCLDFREMEVLANSSDDEVNNKIDKDELTRSQHEIEREVKDTRERIARVGQRIREADTEKLRQEALFHMNEARYRMKMLVQELKIIKDKRKERPGGSHSVRRTSVKRGCRVSELTKRDDVIACDHVGYAFDSHGALFLKCPVGVIDFREGLHACAMDGKQSLSIFKFLGYNSASNTSLVECYPITGRTHQLRVHLKLLGIVLLFVYFSLILSYLMHRYDAREFYRISQQPCLSSTDLLR